MAGFVPAPHLVPKAPERSGAFGVFSPPLAAARPSDSRIVCYTWIGVREGVGMRFFQRRKQTEVYRYTWPKTKILDTVAKHFAIDIISDSEAPEGVEHGLTFVKVQLNDGFVFMLVLMGVTPQRRDDICEMLFELRVRGAAASPDILNEINARLQLSHASTSGDGLFILQAHLIFPEKYSGETLEKLLAAWVYDVGIASRILVQYNTRAQVLRKGLDRLMAGKEGDLNGAHAAGLAWGERKRWNRLLHR